MDRDTLQRLVNMDPPHCCDCGLRITGEAFVINEKGILIFRCRKCSVALDPSDKAKLDAVRDMAMRNAYKIARG
jgi:tRNA(Ile2) C34 agmatinyltransferase TiaS